MLLSNAVNQSLLMQQPNRFGKILTDINKWASWQNEISKPVLNGQLAPGSTFDMENRMAPKFTQ